MSDINAFSLDYDGCFSPFKCRSFEHFHEHNKAFFELYSKAQETTDKPGIFFIGSNRQHGYLDAMGQRWNHNGSAFQNIPKLAASLGSIFDPYLMSDSINQQSIGHEHRLFKDACEKQCHINFLKEELPHGWEILLESSLPQGKVYLSDSNKLHIIYAQAHKVASEYPEANITLHFLDDRIDILASLSNYLSTHPECLPHNLILKLQHYEYGEMKKAYVPIHGTGHIDANYGKTVSDMCELAFKRWETSSADFFQPHSPKPAFASILEPNDFLETRLAFSAELNC